MRTLPTVSPPFSGGWPAPRYAGRWVTRVARRWSKDSAGCGLHARSRLTFARHWKGMHVRPNERVRETLRKLRVLARQFSGSEPRVPRAVRVPLEYHGTPASGWMIA